jgi:hypothetical protein
MSTRKIEIKRRQLVVCVFAAVYLFLVSGRLSPSRENSDEAAHFRAKMQIRVSERVASLRDDDAGTRLLPAAQLQESLQWPATVRQTKPVPLTSPSRRYTHQSEISINGP